MRACAAGGPGVYFFCFGSGCCWWSERERSGCTRRFCMRQERYCNLPCRAIKREGMRPRGRGSLSFEAGPALSWLTARRLNSLSLSPLRRQPGHAPVHPLHTPTRALQQPSPIPRLTRPARRCEWTGRPAWWQVFFFVRERERMTEKKNARPFFFSFSLHDSKRLHPHVR